MGRRVRVVAAALVRDGRLLAAQRAPGKHLGGCWELPGGKVEPGEGDREALARELREELDIGVEVGACIGEAPHDYPSITVLLVAYATTLVDGEPRALEHAELRWVDADGVDELDWAPGDVPFLPAVRALLG